MTRDVIVHRRRMQLATVRTRLASVLRALSARASAIAGRRRCDPARLSDHVLRDIGLSRERM